MGKQHRYAKENRERQENRTPALIVPKKQRNQKRKTRMAGKEKIALKRQAMIQPPPGIFDTRHDGTRIRPHVGKRHKERATDYK